MIRFYYENSNSSSKKALEWFEKKHINCSTKRIRYISRDDLLLALTLSNNGFSDILKSNGKIGFGSEKMMNEIKNMKFNDSINFILGHTEVLKTPIIIDDHKLMTGFNPEEIRKFIPQSYRRLGMV